MARWDRKTNGKPTQRTNEMCWKPLWTSKAKYETSENGNVGSDDKKQKFGIDRLLCPITKELMNDYNIAGFISWYMDSILNDGGKIKSRMRTVKGYVSYCIKYYSHAN